MQFVEATSASSQVSFQQVGLFPRVTADPDTTEAKLCEMRIDSLRKAIRNNEVSFPSQVPTFPRHDRPDLQQKLVQLYFIFGWNGPQIGARYGLTRLRVYQILSTWTRRAVEAGYLQSIPPVRSLKLLFQHPPVQIVLSSVASHPATPVIQRSVRYQTSPLLLDQSEMSDRDDSPKGYRPRRKFGIEQIALVLKELDAGRTVADVADEVGASTSTIRIWRRQHEMHSLQSENTQLREQIEKLGVGEAMLMGSITISDGEQEPPFMPYLQFLAHTKAERRESP